MGTDIIRVVRTIEYEGPREWVTRTLEKSIQGELRISATTVIRVLGVSHAIPCQQCRIVVDDPTKLIEHRDTEAAKEGA